MERAACQLAHWRLVPLAIGLGIVGYALAVAFYTLLGIWRMRRSTMQIARLEERSRALESAQPARKNGKNLMSPGQPDPQPQGK